MGSQEDSTDMALWPLEEEAIPSQMEGLLASA